MLLRLRLRGVHAAAAAEGLTLLRAESSTGFKGVSRSKSVTTPFKAQLWRDGDSNYLGMFATAEEAALAVARFLGPEGVTAALAPEPTPMTAAEAHAAAAAEGLSLVPADGPTGFKGVSRSGTAAKPFAARLWHGWHHKHLGCFATAEEAALAVARCLGPEGVAAALAPEPTPMTAAEAHAAAAAEGLTLLRAENVTGFKGVSRAGRSASKPFQAMQKHDGRDKHLGNFATAEEAALAVARFLGPEGVTAALAPAPGAPRGELAPQAQAGDRRRRESGGEGGAAR
jgi:hypothetical protein